MDLGSCLFIGGGVCVWWFYFFVLELNTADDDRFTE